MGTGPLEFRGVMKAIQKVLSAAAIVAVVSTGAVSPAAAAPNEISSQTQKGHQKINDRDLFSAIFFAVGDGVPYIQKKLNDPEYDSFVAAQSARADQGDISKKIMQEIHKTDSKFFQKFADDMQSGDVFRVESAMQSGQQRVEDAATQLRNADAKKSKPVNPPLSPTTPDPETTTPGDNDTTPGDNEWVPEASPQAAVPVFILWGAVWDAAVAVNYGAAVNVGVAVNAYAYVYAKTKYWPNSATTSDSRLGQESVVATYTAALAEK